MFRLLLPALASLFLIGCAGPAPVDTPLRPKTSRLDWLGHQSFMLTTSLGTKILTNPFAPGVSSRSVPKNLTPSVVLITHEKREANNTDVFENAPVVFRGAVGMGSNNAAGTRIRGTPTFPNPSAPEVVGMNLVFSWTSDGIRFCFLGDVPSPLPPAEAMQIGSVDVLFLPVDGRLGPAGRNAIIAQLRPKVIIPMGSSPAIASWAAGFSKVHRLEGHSVLLNKLALPGETTALVFSH